MNNISKLVIKAYTDNKFSSFVGEFITSINPENLVIKSSISYHISETITSTSLIKYRQSPPKILSFSILFDNTGIIPGNNTITVMEQIRKLQDISYRVHKTNNAPNYIRIIWGQIDFKGRLVNLDIVFSMFQVDGTLVRAEAYIVVLEEVFSFTNSKYTSGINNNYKKKYSDHTISKQIDSYRKIQASQDIFSPTPDSINGPYSGAPPGAYNGELDSIYNGYNDNIGPIYTHSSMMDISMYDSNNSNFYSSKSFIESPSSDFSTDISYISKNNLQYHSYNRLNKSLSVNSPNSSIEKIHGSKYDKSIRSLNKDKKYNSTRNLHSSSNYTAIKKNSYSNLNKFINTSSNTASKIVLLATESGANSLRKLTERITNLDFLIRLRLLTKKVISKTYNSVKN